MDGFRFRVNSLGQRRGFVGGKVSAFERFLPGTIALSRGHFVADILLTVEKKLGEIGEDPSIAEGDAVGSDELPELADDVMDVGNGLELAGEGGEFVLKAVQFE